MAELKGLAHVGVFITDIERSKAFYTEKLGFEVVWEVVLDGDVKVAFVRLGDLTLELVETANPEQRVDGWMDHVAIAVSDIEGVRDMLLAKGIVFEEEDIVYAPEVFPNGAKWMMFRGPDNERLEISEVL